MQIIGVQGLTEEILDAKIDVSSGQGMDVEKSGRGTLLRNEAVIVVEKTNLTEEREKYAIVCKKDRNQEVNNFLDSACQFLSENDRRRKQSQDSP